MQKKNSTKKSGEKKKTANRKRVKVTPKKAVRPRSHTKETTMLTKFKDLLDDTAAKIKTLLPEGNRDNPAKPFLRS